MATSARRKDKPGTADAALPEAIAAAMPPRAATFIVTIYGDVVAPRGGEAWIGSIIAACGAVGISETLVRTAVSRLMAAGQLEGRRRGRRSFYSLTAPALAEFDAAARLIYGTAPEPGWRFVWLPDGAGTSTGADAGADADPGAGTPEALMARLERLGHARLKPQLAVGTDTAPLPPGVLGFAATPEGNAAALRQFAEVHFDLAPHALAYAGFIDRFAAFANPAACPAAGEAALALRLLLVHDFRRALLRDPRLPRAALPQDWPGPRAAQLFAQAYLALSPAAEAYADAVFEGLKGPLQPDSGTIGARREGLALLASRSTPAARRQQPNITKHHKK